MRGFPEIKPWYNLNDEFPNGALFLGSGLLQESLLIEADSDHALVADDHDLAQMLLHLGSLRSPVQILGHPFLQRSHRARSNGLPWFLHREGSFVGIRCHGRSSRTTVTAAH